MHGVDASMQGPGERTVDLRAFSSRGTSDLMVAMSLNVVTLACRWLGGRGLRMQANMSTLRMLSEVKLQQHDL